MLSFFGFGLDLKNYRKISSQGSKYSACVSLKSFILVYDCV